MPADEIEKITANYTVKEVGEMMDRERVANSPILNIAEVTDDPHLNAREYFVEVEHPIIGKVKISPWAMREIYNIQISDSGAVQSFSQSRRYVGKCASYQPPREYTYSSVSFHSTLACFTEHTNATQVAKAASRGIFQPKGSIEMFTRGTAILRQPVRSFLPINRLSRIFATSGWPIRIAF